MRPWWLRLSHYAIPHWKGLSGTGLLMVLGILSDLARPWPLKLMVDYVFEAREFPESLAWVSDLPGGESSIGLVAWLAGATVLLFFFKQGVTVLQAFIRSGVASRMVFDLAGDLFDHMQRLSLRFHGQRPAGDLVRRIMASTGCVRDLVMNVSLPLVTSIATLSGMYVVMLQLDPTLSLVAVTVAVPIFLMMKLCARPMMERNYEQQQLEGEMAAHAERTLSSMAVVQSFTREKQEQERFRQISHRTLRAYLKTLMVQLQFQVGVGGTTAIGTALIMFLGGLHVLQGTLTIGSLLVFLSYLASFYSPLESLAYLSTGYTSAAAGAMRVFEVFDEKEKVPEPVNPVTLARKPGQSSGHIVFEHVTFGYIEGQPVLKDVNLEVKPGETVALVGPTGSGKSTLVSLMLRFYDPWEGGILLDGVNIRNLRLKELRSQFAMVLQDPFLLPLSIAENIAYGRPGASRREIEEAARGAQAMEFIEKLPYGFDTVIGERGATLSGGQKQRISVARALLSTAPILILDEPSSAIDVTTEVELFKAIHKMRRSRTMMTICHRISSIEQTHTVIRLENLWEEIVS